MNFRAATLLVLLLPLVADAAPDPVGDFVKDTFKLPVVAQSMVVTGEVAQVCASVLGRPYPRRSLRYWSDGHQSLWVLSAQGKHGLILSGFVVAKGRIVEGRVLADREQRGRPIREQRYLRQFIGAGLQHEKRLDKTVHAITGATISSTAMERMALLALRLTAMQKDAPPP
ncbi:MAG: FMN-binding protein [Lentisphaerae bacterium]|nr:FMN-binding protein [Lentisphaerota bacterium]